MASKRCLLLFAFLTPAIAFPLAAAAQIPADYARNFVPLKQAVPVITTMGVASAEVVPDMATVIAGVDTERPNAADAARENARAAQAIVSEIKGQGIDPRDIKTLSVTLTPVYDEVRDANGYVTKRTLRGYLAHNSLSVRVRNVQKAGALAGQLMAKGANSLEAIEFDYSQKESRYDALRGEAVRDALRKANFYVNGLGIKLGPVLEIATEGPAPRPAPSAASPRMLAAARTEAAAVPIEPGVETLRIEVQVTWQIAQ
ncbi:MAG TPA: SIMPL domain-containing protein [Methylocella sp.]|nr:SIMPL domain-containing protein [Methylocella sp.]